MHQPEKLTQMISLKEQSWTEAMSVTDRSQQVHQSQYHCSLGQTNLGRITGGSVHKISGTKQVIKIRGCRVDESHHHSPLIKLLVKQVFESSNKKQMMAVSFPKSDVKMYQGFSENFKNGSNNIAISQPMQRHRRCTMPDV